MRGRMSPRAGANASTEQSNEINLRRILRQSIVMNVSSPVELIEN
jgi:hypothetical protein